MNLRSIIANVATVSLFLSPITLSGCKTAGSGTANATTAPTAATPAPAKEAPPVQPDADGVIPSGTGVEKERPDAGKANVQGKVYYNEKPAAGVEVKLYEKFNRFIGGGSGEQFTAKTNGEGEYLIKNVPPRIYEGLLVRVFNTDNYIFATAGIVQSAKYRVEGGQTSFAPDTHLFKSDLKLVSPKAGSKVAASNMQVKWAAYPDAAYYIFNIHPDSSSTSKTEYDYINKRVDGDSYDLDKPLAPGVYSVKVDAFNGNDIKLAESARDIEFTVK